MKIGLGSAQFGMDYGITNRSERLKTVDIHNLIDVSLRNEINFIDTSPSYGNAEKIIGEHPNVKELKICSKINPVNEEFISQKYLYDLQGNIESSLKNLNITKLDTLLVHGPEDLLKCGSDLLFNLLINLREKGLVSHIGASLYSSTQVNDILNRFNLDTLQLPLNLFNQTLVQDGCVKLAMERGVSIHARSILLQGLLLGNPETLDKFFDPIKPKLMGFHKYCFRNNVTPLSLALSYVRSLNFVDIAIVGVTSESELNELISASIHNVTDIDWSAFHIENRQQTNPIYWP